MTARPDGPFQPHSLIPQILLPRLDRTPYLRKELNRIKLLAPIEGLDPNGKTIQSPYTFFWEQGNVALQNIQQLVEAAEMDEVPVVLEVGPSCKWSPLETANNLSLGADGKHPLVIGVNLPDEYSPIMRPFEDSDVPNFNESSWAALFMINVLNLASQPTPPQFDRVHFIAPEPYGYKTIIACGKLVKPIGGKLVAVSEGALDWDLMDRIEYRLTQVSGFESVSVGMSVPSRRLYDLTGAISSDFFGPEDYVNTLVATGRVNPNP